ncbi:MAG: hypothetical protein QOD84_3140 [Acidobacteriaceae bacterium]
MREHICHKAGDAEGNLGACFFAALLVALLLFAYSANAQINGTPASVTSPGFGGQHGRISGVPPSVTSLGPEGFGRNSNFRVEPSFARHGRGPAFPHHPHTPVFPFYPAYTYYPFAPAYSIPYPSDVYPDQPEQDDGRYSEQYNGGPTIFDRRGPGTPVRNYRDEDRERREDLQTNARPVTPPEEATVSSQPPTLLIFKDGHQAEIANYAIVGGTLYDLGGGRQRKIALADLDIAATTKQNDDRGVDFQIPASAVQN